MAHLHKKMKKGRPYYYIREIARVAGKPKVINQVYLGSPKRMLEMATSSGEPCVKVQAQEFGALWLANLIEQEVGFSQIVDSVIDRGDRENGPTVGEYFLYAVFNRMIDARSKRALPEWYKSTAIQHISPTQIDVLDSQHYWRKWERIEQKQLHEIAENFFQKLTKLELVKTGCVRSVLLCWFPEITKSLSIIVNTKETVMTQSFSPGLWIRLSVQCTNTSASRGI